MNEHEARFADPDGYRPDHCPRCGGRMHAHDTRERKPKGDPGWPPVIWVRRYACAVKECRAVWSILPAFLARCLRRAWSTVAASLLTDKTERVVVPSRTRRRWRARLRSCGRKLTRLLTTSSEEHARTVAELGPEPARGEVVDAMGGLDKLAGLAALVHRLAYGVRVM